MCKHSLLKAVVYNQIGVNLRKAGKFFKKIDINSIWRKGNFYLPQAVPACSASELFGALKSSGTAVHWAWLFPWHLDLRVCKCVKWQSPWWRWDAHEGDGEEKKAWDGHEKTWRKLKCALLSGRSQCEKATHCIIPIIRQFGKDKTMQTVKKITGCLVF